MYHHAPKNVRALTAGQLHDLIDDLKSGCDDSVRLAVEFVICESFGYWHNRARAKICRYFKNHPPARSACDRMVSAICGRLISGNFYEQFKDQLSMAIRFDREQMAKAAKMALESKREHVRRYGNRVLHAINSIRPNENLE